MCKIPLMLLALSAIFANCSTISKVETADNNKIDYEAYAGQFPWYAHIQGYLDSDILVNVCGGSIISSNWVMTEAFCGITSSSWHLYFGNTTFLQSTDSSEAIFTTKFITHPHYGSPSLLDNNIGLIQLPTNIEFSLNVRAITLPWNAFDEAQTSTYYVGAVLNDLVFQIRWNFLQIISNEECSQLTETNNGTILCTLGTAENEIQAPCNLNDGAALAYFSNSSWIQIGVGSWPCSIYPSQFTRVTSYIDWISDVTGVSN